MGRPLRDMSGLRVGRLSVVRLDRRDDASRQVIWECRCGCGKLVFLSGAELRGHTKSCGCLKKEDLANRTRTHGKSRTPEYKAYHEMIKRCYNENRSDYHRYGGRGIRVSDEWLGKGGFEKFLCEIGERPSPSHSVDRKDNMGNYGPGNVRWATKSEQARNRRPAAR